MCVRLMLRGEVASVASTWRFAFEGREDAPQVCTQGLCSLPPWGLGGR